MQKDREAICEIIYEMLDNIKKFGVYDDTLACDKLEALMHEARIEAIWWATHIPNKYTDTKPKIGETVLQFLGRVK